ncbi:MAG: class I SAM-dependent methyltransferase [Melioribacteraceae bacterium]
MSEKIKIELGYVQLTLLLPLWGRAIETEKPNPKIIDNTAKEIIKKIDYNFSLISENIQEITQFEWIARSIHIDNTIKEFLRQYPKATIVNVGCGLDTTFDRVDNGKLFWYDLDLPVVIELRRKFISESDRRKFISYSFLDDRWFKELHIEENVLLMAAGVLYYFEENQLKEIFNKIVEKFPGSEIVFDAASTMGVRISNKKVIQSSGLDEKSYLKWGINSATEITKWNNKIKVEKEYPMFKILTKGLNLKNKLMAKISDHYKIMYMVHLKVITT